MPRTVTREFGAPRDDGRAKDGALFPNFVFLEPGC